MPGYKSYGPKRRIKPKFIRPVAGTAIVPYQAPAARVVAAPMGIYRGMRSQLQSHVIQKCCSLRMLAHNTGYSFDIGTVFSQNIAIWFTQQDVFIWANASNYSQVSVPGYSDIAALFDEVMVDRIDMTIYTGTDPTTSANGSGQMVFCRDYNDKNAPTAVGDVQQYVDVRAFNMANNFINKMSIQPKFLTYTLDSAGTSTASTPKRGYCRSNLSTDHYGFKASFINTPPNSQNHTYQFKFTYKCKTPK